MFWKKCINSDEHDGVIPKFFKLISREIQKEKKKTCL